MKQTLTARVAAVGIADVPGTFVTRSVQELKLQLGGIEGDRHFGITRPAGVRENHQPRGAEIMNARQLSLVSVEELTEVAQTLGVPALDWQKLGANLVIEGLPQLSSVKPSTRLVFPSGATIVVDAENAPCSKPARELQQPHFVKAATHKRGLVGWVERAGLVHAGDAMTLWEDT